jgi:hypothetical protein
LDPYGNVATGYTGTVHFSSSDNLPILPGNYLFTSGPGLDNGVHTFAVTLNTTGSQSLTVTDTVNPAITGSQTGIMVAAASLDGLWRTKPTDPEADGLFDLLPDMPATEQLAALLAQSADQPGQLTAAVLSMPETYLPQESEAAAHGLAAVLTPHLLVPDRSATSEAPRWLDCVFSGVAALYVTAQSWSPGPAIPRKDRRVALLCTQA